MKSVTQPQQRLYEKCRWVEIPLHADERGRLNVVEQEDVPFAYERVFWFYGVPEGQERGGHCHRTCEELLIAVSGHFSIELTNGTDRMLFLLDNPSKGLVIPPMVWCELKAFSHDAVGLCFASESYRADGYIHSFSQYQEEMRKLHAE